MLRSPVDSQHSRLPCSFRQGSAPTNYTFSATVQQQQSNIILVSSLLGDEHPQSPEQSGEAAGPLSQLSEPGDRELGAA